MGKEFGKLSKQQIIDFYKVTEAFIDDLAEDFDQLSENPDAEKFCIPWHSFYELTFKDIAVHLIILIGMKDQLVAGIQNGDAQDHFINLMKSGYEAPFELEDLSDQDRVNLGACFMCMLMNFICYASYRTDIHTLLNEAKRGHKESLFMAVNIDHSVVSTDTASRLITKAIAEDDGEFFEMLSKAVKGSYPKKPSSKYAELNFFAYIVEDAVDGGPMDYETLHTLFTEEIPLYPNVNESQDSFGGFKKQLDRTKHKIKDMNS